MRIHKMVQQSQHIEGICLEDDRRRENGIRAILTWSIGQYGIAVFKCSIGLVDITDKNLSFKLGIWI